MRVAIGGISHESSTFTNVATTPGQFPGAQLSPRSGQSSSALPGSIRPSAVSSKGPEAHGFEAVPTMLAEAFPSAPTPRPIFDRPRGANYSTALRQRELSTGFY